MADVKYPMFLPLPQRANMNRTGDTPFRQSTPAVGPAVFTPITTDIKYTWSLTWIFTLEQSERFKSWLRSPNYCDSGRAWFDMPIDLGDSRGVQVQELHFIAPPVQTSKNGITVQWSADVICNFQNDLTEDFDDWIVGAQPNAGYWYDLIATEILPDANHS
ncbi:hypothetical protein C5E18_12085 [Pectobacterium parmentieri]|uniref:hypothetical protein n=1 Tax=Pectobacterium parmentieri TaxID=1905730 RepID=UPI000F8EA4EA|nr:hypothetical protein [Pectobacterium parmentieri]AZS56812.1 hypothetical protein C5E18_12085 [Pectobacterium parmentieri]